MRKVAGALVVVLCVAAVALPLLGQQTARRQNLARSKPFPYSTRAFTGAVPPHYQGNDLQRIARRLATADSPQGEFETAAEYNARIEQANATLADGIGRNSPLAFVFPTDANLKTDWEAKDAIQAVYDADAKTFTVSIRAEPTHYGQTEAAGHEISMVWASTGSSQEHLGTNGFGAVVNMTESTSKHYALSFPANLITKEPSSETSYPLSVSFDTDVSTAKRIKGQLRLLVICRIATSNVLSEADTFHRATLEAPIESQDTYEYVHVIPTEFWIFNSVTGEVLAKTTPLQMARKLTEPGAGEKLLDRVLADSALANQIQTNNRASDVSASSAVARDWDISTVGHAVKDEELPQLVEKGQASRCLIVTNPSAADILVDGNSSGKSPQAFYLMRHGDTPRVITIKSEGYVTVERNFVPNGRDFTLDVALEKK